MAAPELEVNFLKAGEEFAQSLETLGLDAHAIFWAYDETEARHVLIIVTDFFDLKGPLEISKQLFKAYNASITPQQIDPFVVRLHSINQSLGEEYSNKAGMDWSLKIWDSQGNPKPIPAEAKVTSMTIGDLVLAPSWIIRSRKLDHRKTVEINRRWNRFTKNVDKAAA